MKRENNAKTKLEAYLNACPIENCEYATISDDKLCDLFFEVTFDILKTLNNDLMRNHFHTKEKIFERRYFFIKLCHIVLHLLRLFTIFLQFLQR